MKELKFEVVIRYDPKIPEPIPPLNEMKRDLRNAVSSFLMPGEKVTVRRIKDEA